MIGKDIMRRFYSRYSLEIDHVYYNCTAFSIIQWYFQYLGSQLYVNSNIDNLNYYYDFRTNYEEYSV